MSRLRRLLAPVLARTPYRLEAELESDFADVERLLARGDRVVAIDRYKGPLLPHSGVPAIAAERARLGDAMQAR